MGMIGEALAAATASKLEEIILDAIEGTEWSSCRSAVRGFAYRKLYVWYVAECEEALMTPNKKIIHEFSR